MAKHCEVAQVPTSKQIAIRRETPLALDYGDLQEDMTRTLAQSGSISVDLRF
jgi:hypothetical protein